MTRLPNVASLFDSGISIFTKEWKLLSVATILLSLPLYLIQAGLEKNFILFILPYLLLAIIIGPLLTIITISITQHRYDDHATIHRKKFYNLIHTKFFPVLGTTILTMIISFASLILLFIPLILLGIIYAIAQPTLIIGSALTPFGLISGVILLLSATIILMGVSVYLMFALPATVIYNIRGLKAIKESIHLVKGRWWNIFGKVIILQIIAMAIVAIISIFSNTLIEANSATALIITLLQQVAVIPITIALIVLYLDIREHPRKRDIHKTITHKTSSIKPKKIVKKKTLTKKKTTTKTTKKVTKKYTKKKIVKRKNSPKKKTTTK